MKATKDMLLDLVYSVKPEFKHKDIDIIKNNGTDYNGLIGEWRWTSEKLNNLSKEQLFEIYKICKS